MNIKKRLTVTTSLAMMCFTAGVLTSDKAEAYNLMSFSYSDQEDLGNVTYYISEEHFEEGTDAYNWVVEGVEAWNVAPEVNVTQVDNRYDADVIITTSQDKPVFTNGQSLYGIANREIVILYEQLIEDGETYITTVTHEFGHSLGLHHSNEDGSVMLAFIEPGLEITEDDLEGITALYERQEEYNEMIAAEEVWMSDVYMDYQPVFIPHEDYMDQRHIQYTMNPTFRGISINPFDYLMYDSYNMGIPTEDVYFEVEEILVGATGESLPFEVTTTEDGLEIYQFLINSYEEFNDIVLTGGAFEGSEEEFLAELEKQESDHLYVKQQVSTLTLIDQLYSHLELENPNEIGGQEDRPDVSIRDYDPALTEDERTLENYREIFEANFTEDYTGTLELVSTIEGIDHTESFYNVDVTLRGYDVYQFTDEGNRFPTYVDENNQVMLVLFDLAVENGEDVNIYDYDVIEIKFDDPYTPARGVTTYLPDDLKFEELVGESEFRFVPGAAQFPVVAVVDAEQQEYFEAHGGHIFLNRDYAFHGDSTIETGDATPVQFVLDEADRTEPEFLMDVISAHKMADKELLSELTPSARLEADAVDIAVTDVEVTSLTPLPGYEADISDGDAAVTLAMTINNKSEEAVSSRDIFGTLNVDGNEFQALSPYSYSQLIEAGSEGIAYLTFIVPEDVAGNYSSMMFSISSFSDVMMNSVINYETPGREMNLTE